MPSGHSLMKSRYLAINQPANQNQNKTQNFLIFWLTSITLWKPIAVYKLLTLSTIKTHFLQPADCYLSKPTSSCPKRCWPHGAQPTLQWTCAATYWMHVWIKSYERSWRCVIIWAKFKRVHEPQWLLTGSCIGDNDKTESNCKTKAFLKL